MKYYRIFLKSSFVFALSCFAIFSISCNNDNDDEMFDPLDHIPKAFELARTAIQGNPDIVAIAEIIGLASPDNVPLDEKEFVWTYKFQVVYDEKHPKESVNMVIEVKLEPGESVEVACNGSYAECAILEIFLLREEDFSAATVGLDKMIEIAKPYANYDVKAVSINKGLDPKHHYIGYYLLDVDNLPRVIVNAETGAVIH